MVFVVKIGTRSRRGTFTENVVRYVQVAGEVKEPLYKLQNYFNVMYSGFEVKISEVREIDLLPSEKIDPQGCKPKEQETSIDKSTKRTRVYSVEEVKIDLGAPKFSELYNDALAKRAEYDAAESDLRQAVRSHIYSLPQVSNIGDLEIVYGSRCVVVKNVSFRLAVTAEDILNFDPNAK